MLFRVISVCVSFFLKLGAFVSDWLNHYRLIEDEERHWTDQNVDMVAQKHFPNIDHQTALARPILFSKWLSKDYIPVDREVLREYTKARLKVGGCSSCSCL